MPMGRDLLAATLNLVTRILLTPLEPDGGSVATKHGRLTAVPTNGTFAQLQVWDIPAYGSADIDLDPPAIGTAWRLGLTIGASTTTRVVVFTGDSVDWEHLTDVDPDTLTPVPTGPALTAWQAVRDELTAALHTALDVPDLATYLENRIA